MRGGRVMSAKVRMGPFKVRKASKPLTPSPGGAMTFDTGEG
jgi:hypothetical protein